MSHAWLPLALAALAAATLSAGQRPAGPVGELIPGVFAGSRTPVGVLLSPASRDVLKGDARRRGFLASLPSVRTPDDLVHVVLTWLETGAFPCTRVEHPPGSDFTDADPLRMEVVPELRTNLVGTDGSRESLVAVAPTASLGVLGFPDLRGKGVAGAFSPGQLEANRYVVVYRRKHWRSDELPGPADGSLGHTHLQARWGVLRP
jgi:hypothetical protein